MSRPRTGNKRERLIAAAVELFAEKGFFYTTTAEVSAQAGVAAGTLYLYFNSKDDLLVATLNTFLDEFSLEIVPSVYAADTAASKLQTFVREFTRFIEDHRALAQVFFIELCQNNAALRQAACEVWERYHSIVRDLLREVRREGYLENIDLDAAVPMLLGSIHMVSIRWLLGHDVRPPSAHAGALVRAIYRAVGVGEEVGVS